MTAGDKEVDYSELETWSDEELVAQILKRRDRKLQSALYDRYINRVYYKCLSITNDAAISRDYAHDIFIKVFTKLSSFKGRSQFSFWIHAITYNHCIRALQRSRKMVYSGEVDEDISQVDDRDWILEMDPREEQLKLLPQALKSIDTEDRLILMMKYQDGYSIDLICKHFDIASSAAKMRLMRARKKLKQALLHLIKTTSQ